MKPFEQFWKEVIEALDKPRRIRNWTARNGYAITGKFAAKSYRAFDREAQIQLSNGFPYHFPDDCIICTQLQDSTNPLVREVPGITKVWKKEFKDRYDKWRDYRNDGMTRRMFDGDGKASPYLIALFKEFDHLTL